MNPKLYKIMKDVYAEFTGDELADVIKIIRKEIDAEKLVVELETKIIHFSKELSVAKEQQRELRD
jgi:hypothetical protein